MLLDGRVPTNRSVPAVVTTQHDLRSSLRFINRTPTKSKSSSLRGNVRRHGTSLSEARG